MIIIPYVGDQWIFFILLNTVVTAQEIPHCDISVAQSLLLE